MATIINGILGSFTGTAGPVCGYIRNGKNFVRSRRKKSNLPMTPKRLAQQQKIKVCNEFTKPFCGTGFFNKTFPAYGHSGTGFNRATGALMNLAITGIYPETAIDYTQVLISKGPLPAAKMLQQHGMVMAISSLPGRIIRAQEAQKRMIR